MNRTSSLFEAVRFDGAPINRLTYLGWGASLAAVKYAVEAAAIYVATGAAYTPIDFVNPLLAGRAGLLDDAPEWLGVAWLLWSLPFLVSALSLSTRRAIDAARSPWLALLVVAPIGNLLIIPLLASLPSRDVTRVSGMSATQPTRSGNALVIKASVVALTVGVVYTLALTTFSVYVLGDYGVALFFGGPVVVGTTAGYMLNTEARCSAGKTMAQSSIVLIIAMGAMLLLALEGVICLVMAAPLMLPLVLLGALLGRSIALRPNADQHHDQQGLVGALVVLPLLGTAGASLPEPPERMVETSVVVNATQELVWDTVIAFPPIDAPEPWYFRLGIASPQSATLVGDGVGATRYCVFTTGRFVEPITAWEPPRRMAFDVAEQPEPLFELSPYREIHPPHLSGALQSTRGEFRLEPLGQGRTRLVGRTWYRLRMAPAVYWTAWTNAILHRVHLRVLSHIRDVVEAGQDGHTDGSTRHQVDAMLREAG